MKAYPPLQLMNRCLRPQVKIQKFCTSQHVERPFQILGLQDISVGSLNKPSLSELWCTSLGIPKIGEYTNKKDNVNGDILQLGKGITAVDINLMTPLDTNKKPSPHNPPLHHIGLWIDDIYAGVKHLSNQGIRFTSIRKGAAGYDIAFIHPKSNKEFPLCGQGALIKLVQAPMNVIEVYKNELIPLKHEKIRDLSHSQHGEKPFQILGLQQIAIGSLDKSVLSALWSDCFGIPKIGEFRSAKENVDEDILLLGTGNTAVEIDLMCPLNPKRRPAPHKPPLNHIGLWVDDIYAARKYLSSQGMRFTPGGIRKGAAGHDVAFIHPKPNVRFPLSGEGVLIELVQAPTDVINGYKND